MRKISIILICCISLISCKEDKKLDVLTFRTGTFEIPAGDKYGKTTFIRVGDLQIETYGDRVDSLSIHWKNSFNYTLQMLNPTSELDNEPINVKITKITSNSYDFEAIIGHSNYVQKGTVIKIAD